jgi:hypothetical protein
MSPERVAAERVRRALWRNLVRLHAVAEDASPHEQPSSLRQLQAEVTAEAINSGLGRNGHEAGNYAIPKLTTPCEGYVQSLSLNRGRTGGLDDAHP